jgi:hypothetical protein
MKYFAIFTLTALILSVAAFAIITGAQSCETHVHVACIACFVGSMGLLVMLSDTLEKQ